MERLPISWASQENDPFTLTARVSMYAMRISAQVNLLVLANNSWPCSKSLFFRWAHRVLDSLRSQGQENVWWFNIRLQGTSWPFTVASMSFQEPFFLIQKDTASSLGIIANKAECSCQTVHSISVLAFCRLFLLCK